MQNMAQMKNMSDEQLAAQINMLKSNKEMARMAFANKRGPDGRPMDDAQLDMMLNMLTPEMMRMSMSFAEQNPDIVRQQMAGNTYPTMPPQQTQPTQAARSAPSSSQAGEFNLDDQIDSSSRPQAHQAPPPQMPAGMPDMSNMNMQEMMNNPMVKEMMNNPETMRAAMNMMNAGGQGQGGAMNQQSMKEMMENPSMSKLLQNPEMIKNAIDMVKSNPAMMEMMAKQMPGVDP